MTSSDSKRGERASPVDLLIVGAGEYVSGHAHGAPGALDKSAGVVGLVAFDLRDRGNVGRVAIAARDGARLEDLRGHFAAKIGAPYGLDVSFEAFPADARRDEAAYREALARFSPGDAAIVFTPDNSHFAIAMAAVERGLHVLVAKPLVLTLREHIALEQAARDRGVLVAVEMHKRFDPVYADARERARAMGALSLFSSYMSQPRSQLDTFRAWAGLSSDISHYLNAHHVDVHAWIEQGRSRPVRVCAAAADGVASAMLGRKVEDTIALEVEWENLPSRRRGVGIYVASWIAPRSDVHSQQRFFLLGEGGELAVDQAHRGYAVATDERGLQSPNPLFMSYAAVNGRFAGRTSYGYRSLEAFVDAVGAIRAGEATAASFDGSLATAAVTRPVTAILEAGRRSLDQRAPVSIEYDSSAPFEPIDLRP
jgi:D-galacturonate reductase